MYRRDQTLRDVHPEVEQARAQAAAQADAQAIGWFSVKRVPYYVGIVLLLVLVALNVTIVVMAMELKALARTARQAGPIASTLESLQPCFRGEGDDEYQDECSRATIQAIMTVGGAGIPLGDWVNGDLLRLDVASYAKKAAALLPYYRKLFDNIVEVEHESEDDVNNFFNDLSKWVDAVGRFEPVTDGSSAPVSSYPAPLHLFLDGLFGDSGPLQTKQYSALGATCIQAIAHVDSWLQDDTSNLPGLGDTADFSKWLNKSLKPICEALSNAESGLKVAGVSRLRMRRDTLQKIPQLAFMAKTPHPSEKTPKQIPSQEF